MATMQTNDTGAGAATSFARDGFVCPITVMSGDEARRYRTRLEDAEARFGTRNEFRQCLKRYPNVLLPFIDEISRRPEITDVIAEILGPDLLVLDAPLFIKEPNTKSFVSWHQDLQYWGLETEEEVSAWVALTPATKDNGCMRFVAGSQNRRVEHRDTFADENLLSRGQEISVNVDESEATEAALEPGQMSIHHGRVFHSSPPNRSDDRRIGVAIRYMPTRARQVAGGNMAAMLVRGEDRHGNFRPCRAPTGLMAEDDIAHWSEIAGARTAVLMER